jgi:hypothetical protein
MTSVVPKTGPSVACHERLSCPAATLSLRPARSRMLLGKAGVAGVTAYQLRLYKRRPGSMPMHDHVRSIRLEAASDEEAVEQARVAELSDLLSDCAIVFNDAREVIALWNVRDG